MGCGQGMGEVGGKGTDKCVGWVKIGWAWMCEMGRNGKEKVDE